MSQQRTGRRVPARRRAARRLRPRSRRSKPAPRPPRPSRHLCRRRRRCCCRASRRRAARTSLTRSAAPARSPRRSRALDRRRQALASRLAALASRVDKQLLARLIGREQQQAELALVPSELLAVETAGAGLGGGSGAAAAGIDPLAELVAVAQLVDADVLAWPACEDESTPPAPPEPPPPPGQPTGPQEEL